MPAIHLFTSEAMLVDSSRIMSAIDSERAWWLDHVYHDLPTELQRQWKRKEDDQQAFYNAASSLATEEMALDYVATSGLLYTSYSHHQLTTYMTAWLQTIPRVGYLTAPDIVRYWENLATDRVLLGDLLREDPGAVRRSVSDMTRGPHRRGNIISSQALTELRCRWLEL